MWRVLQQPLPHGDPHCRSSTLWQAIILMLCFMTSPSPVYSACAEMNSARLPLFVLGCFVTCLCLLQPSSVSMVCKQHRMLIHIMSNATACDMTVKTGNVNWSLDEPLTVRPAQLYSMCPCCAWTIGKRSTFDVIVQRLIQSMDAMSLDAFIYPGWGNPPRLIGDLTQAGNTPLGDILPCMLCICQFAMMQAL